MSLICGELQWVICGTKENRESCNMADQTELRMNLAAIKRVDPYAKDIVDSSAHVAFYTFNSDENEWEKTDVEGAFFIYSRNAEPYHSIFINNRLNTNSFVEPITGQLELQSQPPFLLYRNERSRIRGFWFYNSSECDRIGELVGRLIKECERKVPVIRNIEMIKQNSNNVDIFTMLSKAQEDFNNSQNQPNFNKSDGSRPQPIASIINQPSDVTSQSVMNFFAAAKPAAASEVPLFQRLLSNPVSVDQIEKQQRATTPQDGRLSPQLHSITLQQNHDMGTSPLAKFIGSSNAGMVTNARNTNTILTNVTSAAEVEAANHQIPLHQLLKKEPISIVPTTSTKPALMPPTMFQSSSSTIKNCISKEPQQQQMSTFLRQQHVHASHEMATTSGTSAAISKPEPLTETQLLQAMMYLIKNDPGFIKKLHEAYLKSFTEMVSL